MDGVSLIVTDPTPITTKVSIEFTSTEFFELFRKTLGQGYMAGAWPKLRAAYSLLEEVGLSPTIDDEDDTEF